MQMAPPDNIKNINASTFVQTLTIKRIVQYIWKLNEEDKRISSDALVLISEYLRLFATEAFNRALEEAVVDGVTDIQPQHIEQILTQFLLDF